MNKHKIIFSLLMSTFMVTAGYCQKDLESHQTNTVSGTVTETDYVGSTVNIKTDNGPMAFYVPTGVNIVLETRDITLTDIKQGDPVTIQYYTSSLSKNVVLSIVDNKPIAR